MQRVTTLVRQVMVIVATMVLFVPLALAEGGEAAAGGSKQIIALACGLAIGIAVFGGATAQGRAAAAALEGIARNPAASDKIFTPMILGMALMESLVLLAFVISFLLLGKV